MIITEANPTRVADLERALDDVQAARPVAMRVLQLADDPHADARKLADAIELDPILTTQVLKLANSAAFGMSGRVGSTQIAVSVLGFSAVRSVATLIAAGLRNLRSQPPAGFWQHSAATAAGCALVSKRFGVPWGDAFALGLLHDLGVAMLGGVDAVTYRRICDGNVDTMSLCESERAEFGMSHPDAAATVLGAWKFPVATVAAIAAHHDPAIDRTPESLVLAAGDSLAHLAFGTGGDNDTERLSDLGFSDSDIEAFTVRTGGRASEVLAGLPR